MDQACLSRDFAREPSTIASWVKLIARTIDGYGISGDELLREAGIVLPEQISPEARIPVRQVYQVWKLAVERTGDRCFALRIPQYFQASVYGPLGLFMLSSRNLLEIADRATRSSRLTSDAVILRSVTTHDTGEIIFETPSEPSEARWIAGEALEAFVATAVNLSRHLVGPDLKLMAVHFQHAKTDVAEIIERYQTFFGAPVRFGTAETKLVYPRNSLEQSCISPNPSVASALDHCLEDSLSALDQDNLAAQIHHYLRRNLASGQVSQQSVASALGLSTRALQRRLQQQALSYSEVLDRTRESLARDYLNDPRLSLIDITFLLGFSDQSNFSRAFRRWTGVSPQQFRRQD